MDHILKTIADFEAKLRGAQDEVSRLKRTINDLCGMAGLPARYAIADAETAVASLTTLRSDQFYGRPMATVVREYLELRKASNLDPPANVNEIYDGLVKGGFKFETLNEKNAKDGLRVSLAKNTAVFHKLPNGSWGLVDWYPNAKKRAGKESGKNGASGEPAEPPPLDGDADETEVSATSTTKQ